MFFISSLFPFSNKTLYNHGRRKENGRKNNKTESVFGLTQVLFYEKYLIDKWIFFAGKSILKIKTVLVNERMFE